MQSAGVALTSGDGVAVVSGLLDCVLGELIEFEGGGNGIVMNLDRETVGVVLLNGETSVPESAEARGTGRVLAVPCGKGLLGRVVSRWGPAGRRGHGPRRRDGPLEAPAPAILARKGGPADGDGPDGHRRHRAHRPRPARADHRR